MAALYSHTTRATGVTLTAAIYNADHENHITNGIPTQLDDYSASESQMQTATSPGTVGAPSLATSLAGEIERLRYVIKTLHGGAQWYPGVALAASSSLADYVAKAALDAQGDFLVAQAASTPVSVAFPFGGAHVINGKVSLSVAGNALTIALKGLDGNDPSASNPVLVRIPQGNPFDGTYAVRKVTAALSMTVSSGSTLGHASAVACPVYFYLIDNSGTIELAVSGKFFDGEAVVSTTAEGGAGASDNHGVMYSTTARSNVPAVCISRWKSTQATAGTWAAVTGEQQIYPFPRKIQSVQIITSSGTYTKPWDTTAIKVTVVGGGGGGGPATDSASPATGGGGGGGGTAIKLIQSGAVSATETVTIGAGGASGAAGGTTSFGSIMSATGGAAGATGTNTYALGGAGGAGTSGGDRDIAGDAGKAGSSSSSGEGGTSHIGGGAVAVAGNTNGVASTSYGGGGSGASRLGGAGTSTGGAGGAGVVIVEEFY